jgi:hypothetical protein
MHTYTSHMLLQPTMDLMHWSESGLQLASSAIYTIMHSGRLEMLKVFMYTHDEHMQK